jgi:hypothetical protein
VSGWVWFVLGALWVVGIWFAWTFMKATNHKQDRMSDEWIERKRRENEQ